MVKYGEYNGQDATIAATIQKVADDIDEALGVVVGSTAFLLNGERDPGVRTKETNFDDFVADTLLWDAQQSSDDSPQCAIANGGSIRSSVEEGDITYGNILDVCPYINYLCTIQVTGSQLLEAIEASCSSTPEELGAFPQVSGMEFTIDTTVSYEEGDLYPDSTYHAPANPGSRVTIHTVDGAPFDENSTYTIAASDFLCAGGDTYYVFAKAAENTMQSTEHLVYDSIRNYLEKGCGSIVGEQYAESQERIKMQSSNSRIRRTGDLSRLERTIKTTTRGLSHRHSVKGVSKG